MPFISANNLHFSYKKNKPVLNGVSFDIDKGQTVVFAGLSGCGKTTLCHILCGIIPNAVKGRLSGSVYINGVSIAGQSLAKTAMSIGLVFQDPDNQIVATTVEDELAFGLENLCVEASEIRRRVDETAELFGLTPLLLKNPASLSGGQKKLVALAAVLILEPEAVILDEPMTALDSEGRELVVRQIEKLRSLNRTVIIVEHDLKLVTFADFWYILSEGKILTQGRPAELLDERNILTNARLLF